MYTTTRRELSLVPIILVYQKFSLLFQIRFLKFNRVATCAFKLSTAWVRYNIENADFRAIKFSECAARWIDEILVTVHHKKIILYQDMTTHVSAMNFSLEKETVGLTENFISSALELETALDVFHKLEICQGCASPSSILNSKNTFTFQDSFGTLRHTKCSLVLDANCKQHSKYCENCKKAKSLYQRKLYACKSKQFLNALCSN